MAAGQDGVQKQRVYIGLKVPAVHLDGELVPQYQGDGEGAVMTANVITYKGVDYEITRIDTFEGYKEDFVLYCKVKS